MNKFQETNETKKHHNWIYHVVHHVKNPLQQTDKPRFGCLRPNNTPSTPQSVHA